MNTETKIFELELTESILKEFEVENDFNKVLICLSQINIFIGENNSGKSRFIRTLFSNKEEMLFLPIVENFFSDIKEILSMLNNNLNSFENSSKKDGYFINYETLNSFREFLKKNLSREELNFDVFKVLFIFLEACQLKSFKFETKPGVGHRPFELEKLRSEISEIGIRFQKIAKEKNIILRTVFHDKVYVPILRGLRPTQIKINGEEINFLNTDNFKHRTIHDYFKKINAPSSIDIDINIETGLDMYLDVRNCLLGELLQRNFIRSFEKYISQKFFQEEEITLIPKLDEDVLTLKIGNNKERPIYDLGDGLQSLIIISFALMNREDPTLIFIEEPEMHLHPKWQKLLISTLLDFPQHQYFISTHSNAFINAENTTIYRVHFDETKNKTCIKNVGFAGKRSLLNELGYEASDLMQTNYVLWVEGFSDKIYINYWIQSMAPELKEGIHYSIMFYGGSNIQHLELEEHFNNLLPLNSNFGIVIDSDKNSETADIAPYKVNIQSKFDSSNRFCWLTKKREIENYLPHEVLNEAVQEGQRSPDKIKIDKGDFVCKTKFSKLDSTPIAKPKIKLPQEIFSEYQREGTVKNIKAADLKKAIDKVLKENEKPSFLSYNKIQVAKRVTGKAPKVEGDELLEKLKELIGVINKANSL